MNCNNGSCGTSSGSGCGCGKCGSGCRCSKCNKNECLKTGDPMIDKMAMLADKAWEAALIDKMKVLWQDKMGEKMDQVAEANVELSMAFHRGKMKTEIELGEAVGKLKGSFA